MGLSCISSTHDFRILARFRRDLRASIPKTHGLNKAVHLTYAPTTSPDHIATLKSSLRDDAWSTTVIILTHSRFPSEGAAIIITSVGGVSGVKDLTKDVESFAALSNGLGDTHWLLQILSVLPVLLFF